MTLRLAANISLMFAELDYLDRPRAAAAAGFDSVESWWPFAGATPDPREVGALVDSIDGAGITLSGLNLFAGDQSGGERGVLSSPTRSAEFAANLDAVADIALRTGCRGFNALYGQREPGLDPELQDALAIENLSTAVRRFADFGGTIYIEALTRGSNGAYPIETAAQAAEVVRQVRSRTGLDNIGLLFDTFHLTNNGEDLAAVISAQWPLIAHVQLADSPGRHEPGSGDIDFPRVLDELWNHGYRGAVAGEYTPTTASTLDTLGWMKTLPHLRRPAP